MRVTNGDIWVASNGTADQAPPLQGLLGERWPVKTAYWLARLARKLADHHAIIDQVRRRLVEQYGTADGNSITIARDTAGYESFVAAFNELMAEEVELDVDKIVLPDSNGCEVTPATLLALMPFLEVA